MYPFINLFGEISVEGFGFEKFYLYSEVLLHYFFFHLCLFKDICFKYFLVIESFFLSECSDSFPDWVGLFLSLVLFPLFILNMGYFSVLECSPMARETWVQSQVES